MVRAPSALGTVAMLAFPVFLPVVIVGRLSAIAAETIARAAGLAAPLVGTGVRLGRHSGTWIGRGAWAAACLAALAVLVAGPGGVLIGRLADPWLWPWFAYAHERAGGTALFDAEQRFVGAIPPLLDSERDISLDGSPGPVDHKAIPLETVSPVFWQCLVHLEDRRLGTWLAPAGIDPVGLIAIPWRVLRSLVVNGTVRLSGASTLPMMLGRMMRHLAPSRTETAVDKIARKFRSPELWDFELSPIRI